MADQIPDATNSGSFVSNPASCQSGKMLTDGVTKSSMLEYGWLRVAWLWWAGASEHWS